MSLQRSNELQRGAELQAAHFLARALAAEAEALAWRAVLADLASTFAETPGIPTRARGYLLAMAQIAGTP